MQQEEALDLLKLGKNIFLTGAAGAGKTYLLNQYIEHLKSHGVGVAVTASTGIAATHLNGKTIHSWSGIGVRNHLSESDLTKLLGTARIKRNYTKTKVLIIDEISMLHGFQLDMVDKAARYILDNNKPFGGIQIVLCGDFFQLPPVANSSTGGDAHFAFEVNAWHEGDFQVCYLEEQHRQKNDPLLQVLNDIRSGNAGEHTKVPLRTRYKKEPVGDVRATKLYARNINVDHINNGELTKLNGQERKFKMETLGFDKLVDGLKRSCLALEEFKVKVGAQVMFIKNSSNGLFVNGTRGVVVGFDSSGWPRVKTFDGETISATPEDWQFEENGTVRATITQVPLRLAWAITIHKSQGMTLDAAEMDLGDTFEPGMGYVALSRVRSLNGLKLMNLNEMALQVHPLILRQDSSFKEQSEIARDNLKELSDEEKAKAQKDILVERFEGTSMKVVTEEYKPGKKPPKVQKVPTHIITMEMLKNDNNIDAIAEKRNLKIVTILGHLEKLKGLKHIDNSDIEHVRDMLPADDFDVIHASLKKSTDGKLKEIFDEFNGKYSYQDIQLVRLFAG